MPFDSPLRFERLPGQTADTVIYRLSGALTLNSLPALHEQLTGQAPAPRTILDLTDVSYMDSAGMSEIITFQVFCQKTNARLIVAGANPRLLKIFRITKVDGFITLSPTVEEAESAA
jgi:anti-anti-sigma factor